MFAIFLIAALAIGGTQAKDMTYGDYLQCVTSSYDTCKPKCTALGGKSADIYACMKDTPFVTGFAFKTCIGQQKAADKPCGVPKPPPTSAPTGATDPVSTVMNCFFDCVNDCANGCNIASSNSTLNSAIQQCLQNNPPVPGPAFGACIQKASGK